jgi:Holliday junction resolvase RusA-like endonuclease
MKGASWTVFLPLPPSVWKLYQQRAHAPGKFKSQAYKNWQADATYAALTQTGTVPRFPGAVNLYATVLDGKGLRMNSDGDNLWKAIADWTKTNGIIVDDSWKYVRRWHMDLDCTEKGPKALVKLTIEGLD